MKLTHVGISSFRSIGEEFVTIDLTKKINVLVGANNCGKSNVLWGLMHLQGPERQGNYKDSDYHQLNKQTEPKFRAIGEVAFQSGSQLAAHFDFIVRPNRVHVSGAFWDSFDQNDFVNIWRNISGQSVNIGRGLNAPELASYKEARGNDILNPIFREFPTVVLVPQFREIADGVTYELRGAGIVARLATWDRPDFGKRTDRKKLEQIRDLLRVLIRRNDAEIEVSREKSQILVTISDLQLPLSSYGTGIHEIIILAIAVLSHDNTLVCIEEPEIHLHPLLQRRFLDFLRKETTNRYVITTHSPALITPNADTAVTHLWLENGVTKSRLIETTEHSLGALRDLGAKASDLLQANSVIWVEGPSDRIYLNRWLELLHPGEFREGIDYSVMFYGGRLLAHVSLGRDEDTPDNEDVDDLVHLLRINQHSAILIDSDRRNKTAPLNATKLRVQQECAASKILCWITDGREIENYLPAEVIVSAYEKDSGGRRSLRFSRFGALEKSLATAFRGVWKRSSYYDHSKPRIARLISEKLTKEHLTPELTGWIERLTRVIRHTSP